MRIAPHADRCGFEIISYDPYMREPSVVSSIEREYRSWRWWPTRARLWFRRVVLRRRPSFEAYLTTTDRWWIYEGEDNGD